MKCSLLYCFIFFPSSDQQKWVLGKMYLNLHGTVAFYHCNVQVPCFLFYPLNSNLQISLQCDSSVIVLAEQRVYNYGKNAHISIYCYGVQRDETLYDIDTVFEQFYPRQDKHCRVKGQVGSCRNLYSQYFSKLSWLGTLPARQEPWNLSRKKVSAHIVKGFPLSMLQNRFSSQKLGDKY